MPYFNKKGGGIMQDLAGKIVLITGGGMGIGLQTAKNFAMEKSKLVIWDLNQAACDNAVKELKQYNVPVHTYVCDVTDNAKVKETAAKVKAEVGKVDVLVNNAGIVAGGAFLDVPMEKHVKTMDVNVNGVMYCTAAFLPDMMSANSGHIVNISSAAGLIGVAAITSYCASKWAVAGFTEALRCEMKMNNKTGIYFSTICPSFVKTGMFDGVKPPMLNPWLSPEGMGKKIIAAVKNNTVLVMTPFAVKTIPIIRALGSADLLYWVGKVLRMHKAMDKWKGH
jgi:all-trans-retinol dehydrogenase (NAD+)